MGVPFRGTPIEIYLSSFVCFIDAINVHADSSVPGNTDTEVFRTAISFRIGAKIIDDKNEERVDGIAILRDPFIVNPEQISIISLRLRIGYTIIN